MTGLEIIKASTTTAGEIADIISKPCPPVIPETCDRLSCRECWLAWLVTGEPPEEKGPSDEQTAPCGGCPLQGKKRELKAMITLTVVEALNDETLRTINNAPRGEALNVTITGEKLYSLSLNSVNTITITVTDGKGGTAYRRLTFKRTNSAPAISGADTDLGLKTGSFAENYTITDVEGDNVVVTEFVDDDEIRSYQATLGEEATIELTREKWLTLANGTHQLRVEAVDGNFATSVRAWIFSKAENTIAFQFSAPEETDARATKILITPTWKIEGAVAKVEACNNAFDAVPTWEDITAMVQLNRVFNFANETKTADKWGVNVRFTIVKNEGYEGEVSISGFGGAYE